MLDLQERCRRDDERYSYGTGDAQDGTDAADLLAVLQAKNGRDAGETQASEAMKRTALRRVTGLSRSTALRPRSRKAAALYRDIRVPLVRRLLAERPRCEARFSLACTGQSVDCHERQTRAMLGSIVDEANIVCCCRPCHTAIHAAPAAARKAGFLGSRWGQDDK